MSKRIRLNGFAIHSPVHLTPGSWTHPRDRGLEVSTLDYWVDLARLLERGLFDSLFIADSLALHDVYQAKPDAALRSAAQVPKYDPSMLVSAMAHATRDLGFGITATVSYESPYILARRFSTLDHLTRGRIGWNIVTGYSAAASRAVGQQGVKARGDRYDVADEFLEATYKLWEGSWEDGAVVADRRRGIYADPSRVHVVEHRGKYFEFSGIHLTDPSPQRTPFLFQAGASPRGRLFAARHAEAMFLANPTAAGTRAIVDDVRGKAVAAGRQAGDILCYAMATVIVGQTERQAREKHAEYLSHADFEGALALQSGWTGIDLSRYDLDGPFPSLEVQNGINSHVKAYGLKPDGTAWTVREVIEFNLIGSQGPVFIGDPQQVADQMIRWIAESGLDGFNLAYAATPESYADVVDLVVPVLQERGAYPDRYEAGVLRQKLFGPGRRLLPPSHPAGTFRRQAPRE